MAYDDRQACELPKQYIAALTGYTYVRWGSFSPRRNTGWRTLPTFTSA